jgi:hypothetical protein
MIAYDTKSNGFGIEFRFIDGINVVGIIFICFAIGGVVFVSKSR